MAKAVLISIRPNWVEKILSGEKTLEVRKTIPKLETPFKVYIYCTAGNLSYEINNGMTCNISGGKAVVGEFVCDGFRPIMPGNFIVKEDAEHSVEGSCLTPEQVKIYGGWKEKKFCDRKILFGWHIFELKIYDTPKKLNEFWLPPELYCEKERCGGCPYDQVADVNGEYSFDCEWKRPLTRPPQSWCYVEEQ